MDSLTRETIRRRAGQCCEYCRLPDEFSNLPFHVEHIVAIVHEPNHHESNLAWACPHCNAHKGPNLTTIDPATGVKVDLFNPRVEAWDDHFAMQSYQIIGLTPIGRGTAQLLKMNAPLRIELRREVI